MGKRRYMSFIAPEDLYERLMRRAAQETAECGARTTMSDLIRWAIEEFLDVREHATLVRADMDKVPGREHTTHPE